MENHRGRLGAGRDSLSLEDNCSYAYVSTAHVFFVFLFSRFFLIFFYGGVTGGFEKQGKSLQKITTVFDCARTSSSTGIFLCTLPYYYSDVVKNDKIPLK